MELLPSPDDDELEVRRPLVPLEDAPDVSPLTKLDGVSLEYALHLLTEEPGMLLASKRYGFLQDRSIPPPKGNTIPFNC